MRAAPETYGYVGTSRPRVHELAGSDPETQRQQLLAAGAARLDTMGNIHNLQRRWVRIRSLADSEQFCAQYLDAAPDSPESFLAILWPALPPGCPTRNWCPSAAVPRRVRAARRGVVDIAVYRLNGGLLSGRSKPFGGPVRLGGVVIFTVIPAKAGIQRPLAANAYLPATGF